jgi:flavin reductase (DIM6/NTAB) family NADH-FMN oxidoreductase RutF
MSPPPRPSAEPADAITTSADYPLYVVTASSGDDAGPGGDDRGGCIVGFATQSSIDPVRFLVCISKVNSTFGVAVRAESLGLHLLGSDQKEMASLFGETTGDTTDKFARVSWSPGVTGAPILAECAAWVEGSIVGRFDAGDHEAFLIAVVDGGPGSHRGRLMFSDAPDLEAAHPAET